MTARRWIGLAAALAAIWASAPRLAAAAAHGDFALGPNAEREACRAVTRFDGPRGGDASDIYCGAWERPSGRVVLYPSAEAARTAVAGLCQGDATPLQSSDFSDLKQIACARNDQNGPRRYVLVAHRGQAVIIGDVFPSDWAPLVNAARVLSGAAPATAVAAGGAETPGLREIQAVFPGGPPGQAATTNYELLLRRAYEYNAIWSFETSERDFEELLRTHNQVAPDDVDGAAEIKAEIGLNMSNARRFDQASAQFAEAEAGAREAHDGMLATKILNYRAVNELNQHHYATAMQLAQQANQARAQLARTGGAQGGARITAGDVGNVEASNVSAGQRSLLVSLNEETPTADRAAILTAQGYYIQAIAARGLGHGDGGGFLVLASAQLQQVVNPPGWLVGDISNEQADSRLAAHDYGGAEAAARSGLAIMSVAAPGTRAEAHLWLTLEGAQAGEGRPGEALASGRQALAIYARQMESPGLPPDVAAPHLSLLESEWKRTGDAALSAEYFQTLSLVWDGAAARTTAQLAARLVLKQAGDQARVYQDAERAYRAALARQQQLAGDADTPGDQKAAADKAVHDTGAAFAAAEAALRDKAPAYLELLSPQASAGDLQAALGDHEAYLRIIVSDQGGFAVLVDKAGVHPFRSPLTGPQVDALADRIRRSTHLHGRRLPDYDLEAGEALYNALVAPIQDRLASVDTLDVDVSGSLASVPFAALVVTPPDAAHLDKIKDDQDYTGVDWLAKHVAVANTLGPASFIRLRKADSAPPAQLRAAVYGDYVPNPPEVAARLAKERDLSDACRAQVQHALQLLGPLPETADEAKAVAAKFPGARLVLGQDFTDADFLHSPDTAGADVIMLATHGVLGMSNCFAEPALLTSVGQSGDGLIEASQLFDTQLKARVVVLSACDTAGGGKLDEARTGLADGGDALSGLARGFIYAGARNVLATEWKVDAATSSAEINGFLAGASQPNAGLGAALAAAQRQIFSQAETGHPFYWAAFVLVGDGGGSL
ncbi:MAG TPA: CHAT domain-containing protein [Caulobacteraceae bacterium]|jgi:CHAT domain-containing protein|nr:CHAT domain-containing protein [Caulobacteraceae bacterium]